MITSTLKDRYEPLVTQGDDFDNGSRQDNLDLLTVCEICYCEVNSD